MTRIKILFFAADPLSAPSYGTAPRLMLDEDIRRIREKVRAAEHRDSLDFDFRLAARTDDLVQALTEVCPQVVHFSGHGGKEGLVLVSADGRHARRVDAEGLAELFRAFRGDIRLVVLNACLSLPQARAIADVVGCAVGTNVSIPDEAAITFGASFYRALASGSSVQAAFDRANAAMGLEHPEARGCTELVVRQDVDASALVLVSADEAMPPADHLPRPAASSTRHLGAGRGVKWAIAAALAITLSTGAALAATRQNPETAIKPLTAPVAAPMSPAEAVAAGRELYQAGNYDAAFPLFDRAAKDGDAEAMGFLGISYLRGQGTARQPEAALHWLRKAGGKRDERAMLALAAAYEQGDGVAEQSYYWALYWYRTAARTRQSAPAMASIGRMFRDGLGVDRSNEQALHWFIQAVSAGSVDAKVDAGQMHEQGVAGPPNAREAVRLYREAATSGSPRGMVEMGRIHRDGVGVRPDRDEAIRWFRKAADAGSTVAAGYIAAM